MKFSVKISLIDHILQEVLGVFDLMQEVQQAISELDYLIESLHARKAEEFEKKKIGEQNDQHLKVLEKISDVISEQEKSAKNELVLTLVVEFVAIPYYLYTFLAHASDVLFHEGKEFHVTHLVCLFIAVLVTLLTTGYTLFKFKRPKENFREFLKSLLNPLSDDRR